MCLTIKHNSFERIFKFSKFLNEVSPPYAPEPSVGGTPTDHIGSQGGWSWETISVL